MKSLSHQQLNTDTLWTNDVDWFNLDTDMLGEWPLNSDSIGAGRNFFEELELVNRVLDIAN